MDAECAVNRIKLIFTKYLHHQVSCLLNACVHLTAVYPVHDKCASVIIQYNITTSPLMLSTSHNVYTCHSPKYHYIIVTVVYLVYCFISIFPSRWASAMRRGAKRLIYIYITSLSESDPKTFAKSELGRVGFKRNTCTCSL